MPHTSNLIVAFGSATVFTSKLTLGANPPNKGPLIRHWGSDGQGPPKTAHVTRHGPGTTKRLNPRGPRAVWAEFFCCCRFTHLTSNSTSYRLLTPRQAGQRSGHWRPGHPKGPCPRLEAEEPGEQGAVASVRVLRTRKPGGAVWTPWAEAPSAGATAVSPRR